MDRERKSTSPGEILLEEFLKPPGITQRALADHIGFDYKVINRLVNEKSHHTIEMATKLVMTFETTATFWLNAQTAINLWKISKNSAQSLL